MRHQFTRKTAVFNDVRHKLSVEKLCITLSVQHVSARLPWQGGDRPTSTRRQQAKGPSSITSVRNVFPFRKSGTRLSYFPRNGMTPQSSILKFRQPPHACLQARPMSSWFSPDLVQDFTIWGGTGAVLKSLHTDLGLEYWTCFSSMNFILRASLVPLVIYGAKTAARYAKVAPEVQFIVTLFQNDLKKMRAEGKGLYEQRLLFQQNMQTVRTIYKLHNINPLTVFLSPFLQIPFFYYVATDLRKIVNGSDPALAQELTESNFLWVTDLTDPDPWFGLPIAAGAMLYFNVEMAIGKKSLSGPAASQSDFAGLLKDLFQTLAVFMPCFTAQSPAGLQIYLVSSFTWTLFQGAALRNDAIRVWVGLPPMGNPPTEPKYAKEFMEFKKLEQKAKEIRGDGPVLGRNVMAVGFETSFPGTNRPSTITGSDLPPELETENETSSTAELSRIPQVSMEQASAAWGGKYIHGISASMNELEGRLMDGLREERAKEVASQKLTSEQEQYMTQSSQRDIEAANLGVKMTTTSSSTASESTNNALDPAKFKRRKASSLGAKRKDGRNNRNKRKP
jgi:membrane protein insertase Oxa1/YidC/SpoIIIJ